MWILCFEVMLEVEMTSISNNDAHSDAFILEQIEKMKLVDLLRSKVLDEEFETVGCLSVLFCTGGIQLGTTYGIEVEMTFGN